MIWYFFCLEISHFFYYPESDIIANHGQSDYVQSSPILKGVMRTLESGLKRCKSDSD